MCGCNKRFNVITHTSLQQTSAHSEILNLQFVSDPLCPPGLPQSFPLSCIQSSPLNHQPLPSPLDDTTGDSSRDNWSRGSRTQNVSHLHHHKVGNNQDNDPLELSLKRGCAFLAAITPHHHTNSNSRLIMDVITCWLPCVHLFVERLRSQWRAALKLMRLMRFSLFFSGGCLSIGRQTPSLRPAY